MRLVCLLLSAAALVAVAGCVAPAAAPPGLTPSQLVRLQHGEWRVTTVDGQPPVAEITLRLGADGRLSGQAGCNGYTGSYSIDGDRFQPVAVASTAAGTLAVGPLASTRKACAPAVMAGEQRFLALLERANGVAMGEGDTLLLLAPPAHRIEARRH